MPEKALKWLKYAIMDKGWWYRTEILEDDDLELLENNSEFISLKSISNDRYTAAVAKTKSLFSWKQKCADNLFLAVHGNTQNSEMFSYTPVANAIEKLQNIDYQKIVCGGFSAGCDMLLRSVCFSPAVCDMLILQSPWIPVLQEYGHDLVQTLRERI